MNRLNCEGIYSVPDSVRQCIENDFVAYWTDEAGTAASIRRSKEMYGYLPDTHTAVALDAAKKYRTESGSSSPILVAATASPFKFPQTILKALGEEVPENEIDMLHALEQCSGQSAPYCLSSLIAKPEIYTDSTDIASLPDTLDYLLK